MPVSGTLPVFVRVNIWIPPNVPRVALGAQFAGDRLALMTGVTPVPVNPTGDPVTVTLLPVMVTVPVCAPVAVGENTTKMVQVLPTVSGVAVLQVPPAVGRENGAVTVIAVNVTGAPPVFE